MKLIIKVVISLALLFLLAYKLDWSQVLASIVHLKWWALPLAIGLQILTLILANWRWWLLLDTHKRGHRIIDLLPQYFVGAFFNNVLPTSTGGDFFRMYYIYQQRHGAAIAASPVITERLIGLVTLIGLTAVVLPFLDHNNEVVQLLTDIVPPVFALSVIGLLLLGTRATYRPLHNFFQRWEHLGLVSTCLHIAEASHTYIARPWLVARLVSLSLCLQVMEIGVFFLLSIGIGAAIAFTNYLVVVPMIMFASAFPLSVGGLGVREAAAVTLFSAVGMSQANAAAVALFFIPVLLTSSLPGLYFFLNMKNHKDLYHKATDEEVSAKITQ